MKYGLISETDARCLEKTIDLICDEFPDQMLNTCEIGVYSGLTSKGIIQYIFNVKKRFTWHTGIDNGKDNQQMHDWFEAATFIKGNSSDVCNQLETESQHLIFIDACHCLHHVQMDFFCYANKVKKGGYLIFHDTGKHIKPFKDYQHGDESNSDNYINVRKALNQVELLSDYNLPKAEFNSQRDKWELIFDEADESNEAGGICVFKKLA